MEANIAAGLKKLAKEMDCPYLSASSVAKTGFDGIHFNEDAHKGLGGLLAQVVQEITKIKGTEL